MGGLRWEADTTPEDTIRTGKKKEGQPMPIANGTSRVIIFIIIKKEQLCSRARYSQGTAIPEGSGALLLRQRQQGGLQVETTATVEVEDTGPDDEGRRSRGDCWTFGKRGATSANHWSFICVRGSSGRWK